MPTPIVIDDPADPRIAPYRDIRERDLVGREGLFVAEGNVVVRLLLARSLHPPVSVLVAGKRAAAFASLPFPPGVPLYAASQGVLDAVAGFPLHRGILAIGRRSPPLQPDALLATLGPRAVVAVLFGVANHDNMGGIFRNAAAFGADAVLIDGDCCDPLYRKAIRVSVGGVLTVPWARFAGGGDLLALLAARGFTTLALSPKGDEALSSLSVEGPLAVLLGAEGPGLSDEILGRARTVRIEMRGAMDSLNVATASGIVLHRLTAGRA